MSSKRLRPLVELDPGAPRIFDERQLGTVRARYDRSFERNACGLELLGEGDEVLYVEADVIEAPAAGRDGRLVALGEAQAGARHVGGPAAPASDSPGSEQRGGPRP